MPWIVNHAKAIWQYLALFSIFSALHLMRCLKGLQCFNLFGGFI